MARCEIFMVVGCPRFAYAEIARTNYGVWALRWLESNERRQPEHCTLRATTVEEAFRKAENFLEHPGLFTQPQPPAPKFAVVPMKPENRHEGPDQFSRRPPGRRPRYRNG